MRRGDPAGPGEGGFGEGRQGCDSWGCDSRGCGAVSAVGGSGRGGERFWGRRCISDGTSSWGTRPNEPRISEMRPRTSSVGLSFVLFAPFPESGANLALLAFWSVTPLIPWWALVALLCRLTIRGLARYASLGSGDRFSNSFHPSSGWPFHSSGVPGVAALSGFLTPTREGEAGGDLFVGASSGDPYGSLFE